MVLSIYLAKSEYLNNISDIVYHSALPMFHGNVHYSFDSTNIMIEKSITKKRLPAPYPSNCTFGADIEDFFSTSYNQKSCIQSCFMREMFSKCSAVVDRWKPFITATMKKRARTIQQEETRICLANILQRFFSLDIPEICHCPISCVEHGYKISYSENMQNSQWGIEGFSFRGHITMDNKRKYLRVIDVPAYTKYDFLTDLTGIIGIFVGMSSLSVLELIVYFYLILVKNIRLIQNRYQ